MTSQKVVFFIFVLAASLFVQYSRAFILFCVDLDADLC